MPDLVTTECPTSNKPIPAEQHDAFIKTHTHIHTCLAPLCISCQAHKNNMVLYLIEHAYTHEF